VALELTIVDAFTATPFTGNPAAVAFLPAFPPAARLRAIAAEVNLSETAFVVRRRDGDHDLRWWTPTVEVDLCGHATLAAAHVLGGTARFHTRSGLLVCHRAADGWISMDLPADPATAATPPAGFSLEGLVWFGRARTDALVELERAELVRSLVPDLAAVRVLGGRGVIVTARGDRPGVDVVSRVFAPCVGIDEDPVTGSAHATLAAHWSARLGRTTLVGEQASARGGLVRMRAAGARVAVAGQAVTVARTTLLV
jgi:predicted PhzF superfamily epimerase YddE/YHI9